MRIPPMKNTLANMVHLPEAFDRMEDAATGQYNLFERSYSYHGLRSRLALAGVNVDGATFRKYVEAVNAAKREGTHIVTLYRRKLMERALSNFRRGK